MKKIGFIDYYLDEWHANNLPQWLKNARRGGEFELYMAYGEVEPPREGMRSNAVWCEENNVKQA